MEEKLKEIGASKSKYLQQISTWAKSQGAAKVEAKQKGQQPQIMYYLAHAAILSQIKGALGLDKCKGYAYGAAPIKNSTVDYFASLDIAIFGGYGMSETCALGSIQSNEIFNLRSVGKPLNGTEINIENPD